MKNQLKNYRLCKKPNGTSLKSKVFCISPWVHMHILPDSRVISCCASNFDQELGYLNKNSLKQIWNGKRMRKIRLNMLSDIACEECSRCYELEKSGGWSMRTEMNNKFSNSYDLVDKTKKDGRLQEVTIRYLDIRFSNLCNFRCRTCDSYLSSGWQADEKKISGLSRSFPMLNLDRNAGNLGKWLDKNLDKIEEVYFAGGEPIISEEHYMILDELLSLKKNNVRLVYNTNLSVLGYKNKRVLDYWKKFNDVAVAASLDAFGTRGELIRKGQDWKNTEKNIRSIKKECPHVKFSISPTVSILNVWHIPDFHKYMIKKGFIGINDIHLNILLFPPEYRAQALPIKYKKIVIKKILKHLTFLINNNCGERIILEYRQLLDFINNKDLSDKFNNFLSKNQELDSIRKEEFVKIFPEFKKFYNSNKL